MRRATQITSDTSAAGQTVTLSYDDRFRRRKTLKDDAGEPFLLDLAQVTELRPGSCLTLDSGDILEIRAADEDVMQATSPDPHHLLRMAWHVGNRHLPCQILSDRLVLRWDHVIAEMLEGLGCSVERLKAPFEPEGGAYGHGRTHSH
jgi:urease accessory protein